MQSRYIKLFGSLLLAASLAACGNDYVVTRYNQIPANYTQFRTVQATATDYLVFSGAVNPTAVQNGTGTNVLYIAPFRSRAPAVLAPSSLVDTTWIGRSGDSQAAQLTITIAANKIDLTLDCVISAANVLLGGNTISLPVKLDGNTIYLSDVFKIVNNDNNDVFSFCAFTLSTDSVSFSSATVNATVTSREGITIGNFVQQL